MKASTRGFQYVFSEALVLATMLGALGWAGAPSEISNLNHGSAIKPQSPYVTILNREKVFDLDGKWRFPGRSKGSRGR